MSEELTRPSPHFERFTSGDLPLDVNAEYGDRPCRQIRATGTGTITVKRASDDAEVTLDVASDGERHDVACSEITSLSGVTAVTVYW